MSLLAGTVAAGEEHRTIRDCLKQAFKSNFNIQIIKKDIPLSHSFLKTSQGRYDPVVSLSGRFTDSQEALATTIFGTRNKKTEISLGADQLFTTGTRFGLEVSGVKSDSNSVFATLNPSFSSKLSLSFSQPLLKNWAGTLDRESFFLAKQGVRITDLAVYERIARFVVNFQRLYWSLVLENERVRILESSHDRAESLLKHNQKRFGLGLVEETDILQLEAVIAVREVDVLRARDAARDAQDLLKNAVYKDGIAHADNIVPSETLKEPESDFIVPTSQSIEKIALVKRWDIQRARLDVENKKYSYHARANERLPVFDINGGMDYTGLGDSISDSHSSISSGNFPVWYYGALFQIPFGNREARGRLQSARYESDIARLILHNLEKEIKADAARIYRRVVTSIESIAAIRRAERLHRRKLTLEEKKFKQGRSSVKTVIDFQDDLQNAQLNFLRSKVDFTLALIQLDFEQGILLETLGVRP